MKRKYDFESGFQFFRSPVCYDRKKSYWNVNNEIIQRFICFKFFIRQRSYNMPQSHKTYLIITGKLTDKQTKRRYKRVHNYVSRLQFILLKLSMISDHCPVCPRICKAFQFEDSCRCQRISISAFLYCFGFSAKKINVFFNIVFTGCASLRAFLFRS